MLREPSVPILLWVAAAMLVHIGGYKGSDEVVTLVEERQAMQMFARAIRAEVMRGTSELSVELWDDHSTALQDDSDGDDPDEGDPDVPDDPDEGDPDDPDEGEPDEPPIVDPPMVPEPPEELAHPEPLPTELPKDSAKPPPELVLPKLDGRIAVVQDVKDKSQKDNPNARFLGDEANWVEKETQARITSTDQMDPSPTPGGNHVGPTPEPGNSDENRVAQSEDAPGEPNVAPEPEPASTPPSSPPESSPAAVARAAVPPAPAREEAAQPGRTAQPVREAVAGQAEAVAADDGSWSASPGRQQLEASKERPAQKKRLPPLHSRSAFGYGSLATTPNGVNLNLSPDAAQAALGRRQLEDERKRDGERRRSEHRGSWSAMGIQKWRAAIENYVASVQPGNQTALNTARVPFASYLNSIHNRIHPIFADTFLVQLQRYPASHPMNDMSISTHMEIVVDQDAGRLVRMGITKTSGVTAFDIGALESVEAAAPFGRAPREIVSPDGNVYLHWEFHRLPRYACSTYFARPYILKHKPTPAPPKVKPPSLPPQEQRHGFLDCCGAGGDRAQLGTWTDFAALVLSGDVG